MSPNLNYLNHLSYSRDLFRNDDGSSMSFYVRSSVDSSDIEQLIQEGGGSVVNNGNLHTPGVIHLTSQRKTLDHAVKWTSSSFIYSCCLKNKLLDINDFELGELPRCSLCDISLKGIIDKNTKKRKYSFNNIRDIVNDIVDHETLWQAIEERKLNGHSSWRTIRSVFSMWAFLHLKCPETRCNYISSCCRLNLEKEISKYSLNGDHSISGRGQISFKNPIKPLINVEVKAKFEETEELVQKNNEENEISEIIEETSAEDREKIFKSESVSHHKEPELDSAEMSDCSVETILHLDEPSEAEEINIIPSSTAKVSDNNNRKELADVCKQEESAREYEVDSDEFQPKYKRSRPYTIKEDMKIIHWIIERRNLIGPLSGNRIWRFMEKRNVLPNRTWQSLRERFRRRILPNLKKYPLSNEERSRLRRHM